MFVLLLLFSDLQANWTFCPLGSRSFRITINNTDSFNYHLIPSAATFFPLQFPLILISDVCYEFSSFFVNIIFHYLFDFFSEFNLN